MKSRILIVEDDTVQRTVIADILTQAGHDVTEAASGEEAVTELKQDGFALVLTDMRMGEMSGLDLLKTVRRADADAEVVLMTAHATVSTAVMAMKEGATDYLAKPFDKDELLVVVEKALERASLVRQNRELRALVDESTSLGNLIGQSAAMRRTFNVMSRAVKVNSTALILGESGTGKEMVARHLHFAGARKNKPFVVVNCAAIPDNLVESELFGHEKGSFTGADAARPGKFEAANGGTIFLDEIGDMNVDSQAKLLRVLQDGIVERVGTSKPREVDVRVIAATNRDLRELVNEGAFREDLYYRLDVLPIELPPLRDRIEDLPLLVRHFREKLGKRLDMNVPAVGADVIEAFRRYRWPGNVRELENTLEQLFILCDGDTLTMNDLPGKFRDLEPVSGEFVLPPGGIVLEDLEQDLIRQALDRSGGRIKEAAELLGLTYKTLQYRLKKHGIDREG